MDGFVDKSELLDEIQQMTIKEGDVLELYVVALSEDEIKLSRAIAGIGGLHMLKEAHAQAVPVEGKILETCKGGFLVEILERRAFCPISQVDSAHVENPADYVGGTFHFLITKVEDNGKNIVVSRRILLAREQEKARKQFYETLRIGMIMEGTVTRVMPYGAFVELAAGVEGMVHISELSWSRTATPAALVGARDRVTVKVIGIEPNAKPGQFKISLSMKQTSEDPWNRADTYLHIGDKLHGKVTRCAKFGVFVEVAPGIEGLVHISEMSYTKRVVKPDEIVSVGDTVAVMVREIDLPNRRVSLSIRDAEGDPWIDVASKYAVGQALEGRLEKKEKFGYFISLEPGVTGLLPKSNIAKSLQPSLLEKHREGDLIAVVIEAINPEKRKITLTPGDTSAEPQWQTFSGDARSSMGALGEKLKQALAKEKEG
jgi:small subunit ribosomal protein S1